MSDTDRSVGLSDRVYRVDRFTVPNGARDEFLARVRGTHELLRTQPGFVQDFVLERRTSPESLLLLTIVEWKDAQAVAQARSAVQALHARTGFDAHELMQRLGITPDMGTYEAVVL